MQGVGLTSTFVRLSADFYLDQSNLTCGAQLELTTGADPRFEDLDPQNPAKYPFWLSFDLRFFKMTVPPNGTASRFNAKITGAGDAAAFIAKVIHNLTHNLAGTDGFQSGLTQDQDASALEFHQQDTSGNYVFNFAVARVRLRGSKAATAHTVRVFFRLFQAQNTASDFNPSAATGTYRFASDNVSYGHKIALLGVQNDAKGKPEYVTIPCFASPRINLNGPADMTAQVDSPNAYDIKTTPGVESDSYFGCWLDINQPQQKIFPQTPPPGDWDGTNGWKGVTLHAIHDAMSLFSHQCLIAEIRFDDTPIPPGATPGNSDKLAQRNIAWIDGPNPGSEASRRMSHPVQLRPTPKASPNPDELMILWNGMPQGSKAQLFLPAVGAAEVLSLADRRYSAHQLRLIDSNTVGFPSGGATFIPLPDGEALSAGLLAIDLPAGVRFGDSYTATLRQLTDTRAEPPPVIEIAAGPRVAAPPTELSWRQVLGASEFRLMIQTREELLLPEERLLALLRWILLQTPPQKRWYPVLLRYIADIVGRVRGFGGDPDTIQPSPVGDVPGLKRPPPPTVREVTGKIETLIYDHFGDFEGFVLETQSGGHHHFYSREATMQVLVRRAWIERTRMTVYHDLLREDLPLRLLLHAGSRQIGTEFD
jgi:hypothetical protein